MDYLDTADFASTIRRSPEAVRYRRKIGQGPRFFKVGRRVLYARADVESWIEGLREGDAA